jgi:hypothetical protein
MRMGEMIDGQGNKQINRKAGKRIRDKILGLKKQSCERRKDIGIK